MPVTLPVIDSDGMGDANREGDASREGEVIVANPILSIHATAHQLGVSEIDDEADAHMMWEMSDEAERILREQAMAEGEEDDDGGGRTAEEDESQEDEEMQEDDEEETSIWEDEFSEDGDFDIEEEFEDLRAISSIAHKDRHEDLARRWTPEIQRTIMGFLQRA